MRKLTWLALAVALGAAAGADPALAPFRGKVAFDGQEVPALRGAKMAEHIKARLTPQKRAKDADGPWTVHLYAVLDRLSYKGPVTVWAWDKADPESRKAREPVFVWSLDNPERLWSARGPITLDPDAGFNRAHTYVIEVGQILNGKETIYARGELTLE
jgi:hypothetical protein